MTLHPRERAAVPRRQFIRLVRARRGRGRSRPVAARGCGGDDGRRCRRTAGRAEGRRRKLSRPDDPATLPTFDDIPAIADGLPIETGHAQGLQLRGVHLPRRAQAAFEKEYGVTVEVTTFTSMDEAVAKLASGEVAFDVFFPTPDRIGKLAAGKLLQPLNKTYLPNLTNVWESLQDPFYDQGSVYTVPYTLYTTGIGYRIDAVAKAARRLRPTRTTSSGTPANAGQVYVLEDDREVFGMAMLRADPDADVNTEDAGAIDAALADVVRAHRRRQRQGRRRGLHRAAREAGLGAPVLVGRRRQRPVLPARGRVDRQHRLLVPARRQRRRRQRHASPSCAARPSRCSPTRSSTTCSTTTHALENYGWLGYQPPQNVARPRPRRRRRVRAGPPGHRGRPPGGLRRPASSCCSCRWPASGSGTTPGRRSRPVADIADASRGATRRLWPALAAPGVLWLVALFVVPFYGVLAVAFGTRRPDLRQRRAGVEPAATGTSTRSATSSSASSSAELGDGLRPHRSCTSAPRCRSAS